MGGTRRAKRAQRLTRRKGQHGTLSVAVLHTAFEKLDERMRLEIGRGATDSELGACLKGQWSTLFQSSLSPAAVRGMVLHYRALYKAGPRKTRKAGRRGQKGGMAPIGYGLGQGIADPVYGRFPVDMGATPRVVASLDRFYENPVSRACDSTGGHDAPVGQQEGGGLIDAMLAGKAPASIPHNVVEMGVSAIQGASIRNPPGDPVAHTWQLSAPPATVFNPSSLSNISNLAPIYNPV
jgi:hypothetical protein